MMHFFAKKIHLNGQTILYLNDPHFIFMLKTFRKMLATLINLNPWLPAVREDAGQALQCKVQIAL